MVQSLASRNWKDFVFGLGLLIIATFTWYTAFFPVQPFSLVFYGRVIDLTLPTLCISFFSTYVSLGWLTLNLLGLFATIKHKIWKPTFPQSKHNPHKPMFTVLVPACNEERVVGNILEDLLVQTYQKWECFVICHNCTDNTVKIVAAFEARDKRIKSLVLDKGNGKPYALNHALQFARGEVITTIDADGHVKPEYLQKLSKYFPKYDATQSYLDTGNRTFNFLTRMQDLEFLCFTNLYQHGRRVLRQNCLLGGTGQSIKKSILLKHGGWSGDSLTEDYYITMQMNVRKDKIAYAFDTILYDEKVPWWTSFFRQRARWLRGNFQVFFRFTKDFLKIPTEWHILCSQFGVTFYFYSYFCLLFYLLGGQIKAYYLPSILWMSLYFLQLGLIAVRMAFERGVKSLVYFPLFLLYLYHWIPAMLFMTKVKTWNDSKTPHGFLR